MRRVQVTGLVDDILGLSAYMDVAALHQMMREGDVSTGALLLIDSSQSDRAVLGAEGHPRRRGRRLQARHPAKLPRDDGRQHEPDDLHQPALRQHHRLWRGLQRGARVAVGAQPRAGQPARARLHARRDFAHPDGRAGAAHAGGAADRRAVRYSLAAAIVSSIDSEVYRFPLYVTRQAVAISFLGIIGAAVVSGLLVRRRLDQLDLVAVLKIRE